MKKYYGIVILLLAFVIISACGNLDSSSTKEVDILATLQEKGTVQVGFANEKPYAYEEDGELKGAAVDIAKAVFKELGIDEVEGKLADFGQLIPGLNAGKFDAITAGMAIQPDRCENAAFAEPEIQYGEGMVVQAGNPENLYSYKDIADNPNIKVAVMAGASENDFLIKEGVSEDQIMSVPDIPASFSAVESGRVHATTATEMTVKEALQSASSNKIELVEEFEQPDIEGIPSYGAPAFRKDNEALRDAYNEALAKLKADGTIAELAENYGFTVPDDSIKTEKICSGEQF
ncbi:ectoine/hydroxyectoine ABC transporter substrate-binding protein EhuB [Pueribacillus sp. YX66]|uniref:ectoine/hydroxyectoine ABC transporter substrate-binding protein EhuB n=1 Tax=Pueribacillus sp. YX66 TaxID=3229242 RepID=UPI00358D935B